MSIQKGKKISCNIAKNLGENKLRTFSMSTSDGINFVTGGLIQDVNSNIAHSVMIGSTAALFFKQTRVFGIAGWLLIFILWAVGQKQNAWRQRPLENLCN